MLDGRLVFGLEMEDVGVEDKFPTMQIDHILIVRVRICLPPLPCSLKMQV